MRFTPVAFALTLAASVMAAPTATWETSTCECAPDNHGALGELANYGAHWYQCVYPFGNCIWNDAGKLLTTSQDNCAAFAPCQ